MYEVTDCITYAGHNNFTTALMANKDFYDGLSEEEQQVIQEAVEVAFDYIIEYQEGLTEASLAAIRKAKPEITITVLSEEERKPFKAAAEEVEQAFIEMTGESGQRILEQMKQDLEEASQAVGN